MANPNLGAVVVDAWERVMREHDRRVELRITELHNWKRHRNGRQDYNQLCAYCHKSKVLTQDHVIPLSKGGQHTASNIVPACRSCNASKGNREAPTSL